MIRNTSLRRAAALGVALGLPGALSFLGTVSLGTFSLPAFAAGDKAAQAEELFQKGLKLMADKKFSDACPLFAASQKMDPSIGTLGKLAECHEKEGKTASAWGEYREVAQLAKKDNDQKREKAANERAALLEPKLMRLNIVVEPGASVTVLRDGEPIDPNTYGIALATDPGEHRIEAKAPGKVAYSTKVTLDKPGATVDVKIPALENDAAPAPSTSVTGAPSTTATVAPTSSASTVPTETPPPGPPPSNGSGMRAAGFTLAAVGVGGIVVGSVFGLTAKSKWDKGKADCPNNQCKTDEAYTLTQDAKKYGNFSTIGFVVGGVALAAGIVLVVVAPSAPKKDAPPTASLHVAPAVGPTTVGFSLGGNF
ncbi:MAG: hypothetical protein JNL79_24040 [Myxococcales bacterium]|nr:hypothetical protein [Myxococcales bacterium]